MNIDLRSLGPRASVSLLALLMLACPSGEIDRGTTFGTTCGD